MNPTCRGFTLLETVLALGWVAGAVMILFGLLSPMLRMSDEQELRQRAAAAAETVEAYLEARGLDEVAEHLLLNEADIPALGDWDGHRLFVDRDAGYVGTHADIVARGYERFEQAFFFEAIAVRNSAPENAAAHGALGATLFHLELTWPAGNAEGRPVPRQHRNRLVVTTALRR